MTASFTVGSRVAVMNQSFSGKIVFEGWAEITKILAQADHACRAKVKFLRGPKDRKGGKFLPGTYERNIHIDWQVDPEAFVEATNARFDFPEYSKS